MDKVDPPEPQLTPRRWVLWSLLVGIVCCVLVCLDYGSRRRQEEPSYEVGGGMASRYAAPQALREQIHRNMIKRSPSFPSPQQNKPALIGDIASQIIDTYDS